MDLPQNQQGTHLMSLRDKTKAESISESSVKALLIKEELYSVGTVLMLSFDFKIL